jgi:hypothetical protein
MPAAAISSPPPALPALPPCASTAPSNTPAAAVSASSGCVVAGRRHRAPCHTPRHRPPAALGTPRSGPPSLLLRRPCELAASDAAGHRISWRCSCGGGPRHGRQAMPQKRGRQRICAAGTRAHGRSRRGHLPGRRLRGSARQALAARIGRCLWGNFWHRASAINI